MSDTAKSDEPALEGASPWAAVLSRLIAVVFVLALGVIVLAGGPVLTFETSDIILGRDEKWEYGWPVPFLCWEYTDTNLWVVKYFDLGTLVLDLLIGALVGAAGFGFAAWWRRSRQHWLQIYLGEVLIVTTLVALALGWFAWARQVHADQLAIADALLTRDSVTTSGLFNEFRWDPTAPAAMKRVLPREWFTEFERVAEVWVRADDLPRLAQLRTLRCVLLTDSVTAADLEPLSQLPELEALQCSGGKLRQFGSRLTLARSSMLFPPLPQLRALQWEGEPLHPDCALRLPRLEALTLRPPPFGLRHDESVEALVRMKQLRRLWIGHSTLSPDNLARLRRELPNCDIQFSDNLE